MCHRLEISIWPWNINELYMYNHLKINPIPNLKKKEIFENCRKLKGTNIITRQDVTYIRRQEQTNLREHLKKVRENSEIRSFIKGNIIYWRQRIYH